MKVLNTKPDPYLIQCIEIDLYDILYKQSINKLGASLTTEVRKVMREYKRRGLIHRYRIVALSLKRIVVNIYAPGKVKISCVIP